MSIHTFHLECLEITANALIFELDRNNIFPPLLNDPERIISNKCRKSKVRKRTPNAFFVCRMNVQEEVARKKSKVNMRVISKAASILWKNAYPEEKYEYKKLADIVKVHFERTSLTCIKSIKNSYNPYHSFPLIQSSKTNQVASDNNLQAQSNSEVIPYDLFNDYNLFHDIQFLNFL